MYSDTFQYKSANHPLHTEDDCDVGSIGKDWQVAVVMDGCSSGKESHIISGVYKKLFRKALTYLDEIDKVNTKVSFNNISPNIMGKLILNYIFDEFKNVVKTLNLSIEESLSTLLLVVYNTLNKEAFINVSGDGFFSVNNNMVEIDQNNIPDFMGYHLKKDFEQWFKMHTGSYRYMDVDTIAIATDGISKFRLKSGTLPKFNDAEFFLDSTNKMDLKAKFDFLTREKNLIAIDDIAVVEFRLT